MKKTIYKGICLGAIVLCLTLIVGCVAPLSALAAETTTVAEQDSVHFINPTAITVVGDCLYVADIVENGKTALLCFDLTSGTPALKYTYEMDGEVSKLSDNGDKLIYAICGSKVVELELSDSLPTVNKTYNFDNEVVGFVMGTFLQNKVEFALTDRLLRYNRTTDTFGYATQGILTDTKGCVTLGDIVYYVHKNDSNFICNGYTSDGLFLDGSITIMTEPIGITTYKNNVAFFSQHSITYVNDITMGYWTNNQTMQGNALENLIADTGDKTILDVAINGETIFVLNESINKIDMYVNGDSGYYVTYTIGSDVVNKTVPTAYTSFTLARPNGYPANIVYKTNAATSIDEIITDASEYVILGYAGDADSHYYYVMVGDKFGWVKKSDGTSSPTNDNKLSIVNNNLGDDIFGYEASFTSLKGVYVYDLPLSSANQTAVSQSASTMKTVKVLQEYKEGEQVWYYVSYDEGKTGFVKKSDVGQLHITANKNIDELIIGHKIINSSLFAPVYVYKTEEMVEGDYAVDYKEDVIKLYSGDQVTLVKLEGEKAMIMILHSDGKQDFGWLEASRLIERGQMTTNAIVGLVLLAVAIALATVLLVVYFKRKKKIRANNN